MKGRPNSEFGTIDPAFPATAYMMFVFMVSKKKVIGIYPLSTIFTSREDACAAVREMVEASEEKDIDVPEIGILIPVRLERLYPLEERFWDNPTHHYHIGDRMNVFLPVANKPQMYKLLVTPSHYDAGTWYFSATLPFLISADDTQIERFMMYSDHPVDIRAKHAAIYLFENPISLNWMTGEEQKVEAGDDIKLNDLN